MQIVQTVPVIVGEAVAAGLIVAFVTFVTKRLLKSGRQDAGLAVAGNIGENSTNSPIAFGATVHQSIVYNGQSGAELEKQRQVESGPSPTSVTNFYDRLTPYERIKSGQHHQGIKVRWRLSYSSIYPSEEDANQAQVWALPADGYIPNVIFQVNLKDSPEFKIAHSGEIFWLDGTIQSVDTPGIMVECHRIHWEQPAK
jgi:hypothetical protein